MRALLLLVARARALDDAQRSFLAAYARGAGTVARPSGLLYRVKRYGFGGSPALDAACDVAYDGKLSGDWPDGPSFDGTRVKRRPSTFAASKVIACWREAMPLMTVGSVWELACPPALGYGPRAVRDRIPGGSVLVFELELLRCDGAASPARVVPVDDWVDGDAPPAAPGGAEDWPARAAAVAAALRGAFRAWEERASPRDDLRPVSGGGLDWLGVSATLYDSLDALYVCGLRDDYDRAVARVFAPSWRDPLGRGAPTPYRPVKVFEYHLRVVGGLLGAFEVSGDRRLLGAARHAAEAVAAAFPVQGGPPRPYARLAHPRTAPVAFLVLGLLDGVRSVFDGGVLCASLAGFGSFGLEFRAIARDGRAPDLLERADRVFDAAYARWAADGGAASQKLVPKFYEVPPALGPKRGCLEKHRLAQRAGLGSGGDSFYEYLLKEQLLRGAAGSTKRQAELWDWLAAALLDGARGRDRVADVVHRSRAGTADVVAPRGRLKEHLAFFAPGLLALGSAAPWGDTEAKRRLLALAAELAESDARLHAKTGLGPELSRVDEASGAAAAVDPRYGLRPEYVESLFVLYRVTGDDVYRRRGWAFFEALVARCRVPGGGFAGLADVSADRGGRDDDMPSFFLAETLKYLYLLFSDRDYYPLEDWVFTTEAHLISARPRCDDGSCFGSADRGPLFALPLDLLLLLAGGAALALLRRRRRPRLRRDS